MYNTCRVPVFCNYGQIKEWYDKTKPIRGRKVEVRPYGERRYVDTYNFHMDGEDVVLVYATSIVAVWHPDDSITVRRPRWCGAFEPDKLAHYLPPRLSFEWDRGRFILFNHCDNTRVEIKEHTPVHAKAVGVEAMGSRNIIVRKYETQGIPDTFRFEKKRGASKRIMREKYSEFLEWVQTIEPIAPKMTDEETDPARMELFHRATGVTKDAWATASFWNSTTDWSADSERKNQFYMDSRLRIFFPMPGPAERAQLTGAHRAGVAALCEMMLPENQDQWFSALQVIVPRISRHWSNLHWDYAKLERYVEELVCVMYRDEVFTKVPLAAGDVGNKLNEKYFRDVDIQFFEKSDTVSVISS